MKAKKIIFLLCFLSALFLTGCSTTKTPYLDESSRNSIEGALLSSLHIEDCVDNNNSIIVELHNTSNYDLEDLYIRVPDNDDSSVDIALGSIPHLKRASYASINIAWPVSLERTSDSITVYCEYTVGAYNYRSEQKSTVIGTPDSTSLIIAVETKNGKCLLESEKTVQFNTENEPAGLLTAKINSLTPHITRINSGYSLTIDCEGVEPSGKGNPYLGYKLIDSQDVIRESDVLYFGYENTATCYFNSLGELEPGEYILRFEEHD